MTGMVESLYNERTRVPVCYAGCFLQCVLDRVQPGLLGSGIGPLFSVREKEDNVNISGDW